MRRIALVIGVLVIVGAVVAIAMMVTAESKPVIAKESNEPVDSEIVQADTTFGFNLVNELIKEEPDKNVFISPASVSLILSMTYNGATNKTKDAMAKTLQIQGLSLDEVNKANSALMSNLEGPGPGVEIRVANSLWAKSGVPFKDDFMQRNRKFYRAEVRTLNLQDPKAKDTINAWVSKKTNGKIPEIIDTVNPLAIMFLINAVYFKGEWQDKFDESATRDAPFSLADGKTKTVKMMTREGDLRCLAEKDFQAVSLPYGKGRLSMYIFLPRKDLKLSDFAKQLTPANWEKWMRGLTEENGTLGLPKFKIEYTTELKNALTALGMGIAFEEGKASFGAMTPIRPVWINRVRHKTFVEVNEKGTEAAAATSVEMGATSARPEPKRFEMIVDHPFLAAIRDNKTGAILFLGAITEP